MSITVRRFVTDFEKIVSQNVVEESMKLSRGIAPDYAIYKQSCGYRAGLEAAVAIAREMLKQIEDLQDRDEGGELPEIKPARQPKQRVQA